ncbi:hypothetical protein SAMN05192589_101234 [Paracidovorax valerianellae]|uniref:Uncharacterized protein n=1 Tax=Paracidovorax valerianellae TaxID=187868 RepID=A0A1G6IRS6_9BURK|nr:hypothetical protein SAMN05192589_101234 [Paracidovorax valerianellae]
MGFITPYPDPTTAAQGLRSRGPVCLSEGSNSREVVDEGSSSYGHD